MIQGIYQSAAGMMSQMEHHQVISENLASLTVPGFRRNNVSFESYLADSPNAAPTGDSMLSQAPILKTHADFSNGRMEPDGVSTHLAISGPGFFSVEMPGRGAVYTRNGFFTMNSQGEMLTGDGFRVLGQGGTPLLIPKPAVPISINETGEVIQEGTFIGKVQIAEFKYPTKDLQWVGSGYFVPNDSAQQNPIPTSSKVVQGFLETSNVNPVQEMVSMIQASRAYEANQKILQTQDSTLEQVIRQASFR